MQQVIQKNQQQNLLPLEQNNLSKYLDENIKRVSSNLLNEEILEKLSIEYKDEIDRVLEESDQSLMILLERSFIDDLWDKADVKGRLLGLLKDSFDKMLKKTVRGIQPFMRELKAAVLRDEDSRAAVELLNLGREHYKNALRELKICQTATNRIVILLARLKNLKATSSELSFRTLNNNPKRFANYIKLLVNRTEDRGMRQMLNTLLATAKARNKSLKSLTISHEVLKTRLAQPYGLESEIQMIGDSIEELTKLGEKIDRDVKNKQSEEGKSSKQKSGLLSSTAPKREWNRDPNKFNDEAVREILRYVQTERGPDGKQRYSDDVIDKWNTEYRSRQARATRRESIEVKDFKQLLLEYTDNETGEEKSSRLLKELNNLGNKILKKIDMKEIEKKLDQLQEMEEKSEIKGNVNVYTDIKRNIKTIHKNVLHDYELALSSPKTILKSNRDHTSPYHIAVSGEIVQAYYQFSKNMEEIFDDLISDPDKEGEFFERSSDFIVSKKPGRSGDLKAKFSNIIAALNERYYNELLHISTGIHDLTELHEMAHTLMKFNEDRIFHTKNHSRHTSENDFSHLLHFIKNATDKNGQHVFFDERTSNGVLRNVVDKHMKKNVEVRSLIAAASLQLMGPLVDGGKNRGKPPLTNQFYEELKQRIVNNYHNHVKNEYVDTEQTKEGWEKLFLRDPKKYSNFIQNQVVNRADLYMKRMEHINIHYKRNVKQDGEFSQYKKSEFHSALRRNHVYIDNNDNVVVSSLGYLGLSEKEKHNKEIERKIREFSQNVRVLIKKESDYSDKLLTFHAQEEDGFIEASKNIIQLHIKFFDSFKAFGELAQKYYEHIKQTDQEHEKDELPLSDQDLDVIKNIIKYCLTENERKTLKGKSTSFKLETGSMENIYGYNTHHKENNNTQNLRGEFEESHNFPSENYITVLYSQLLKKERELEEVIDNYIIGKLENREKSSEANNSKKDQKYQEIDSVIQDESLLKMYGQKKEEFEKRTHPVIKDFLEKQNLSLSEEGTPLKKPSVYFFYKRIENIYNLWKEARKDTQSTYDFSDDVIKQHNHIKKIHKKAGESDDFTEHHLFIACLKNLLKKEGDQ